MISIMKDKNVIESKISELSDEELAIQAQDGDDTAFNALTVRHIQHIFNFVRQYVPKKEDVEDVVQNTFFKAWKHIKSFKKDKKFKGWLFAIARNTALDHLKKKRSFSFSEMSSTDEDSGGEISFADTLGDPEPLPHEVFERKEIANELMGVLDQLSPDYRATLIMHYNDEMTFEEIATIFKKPMNTVKSWHRRALKKVRELMLTAQSCR